jgi:hypothetical protein
MAERCAKKTRRCINGLCYKKKAWRKKTAKKRCTNGTRRCRDNKCHKKK